MVVGSDATALIVFAALESLAFTFEDPSVVRRYDLRRNAESLIRECSGWAIILKIHLSYAAIIHSDGSVGAHRGGSTALDADGDFIAFLLLSASEAEVEFHRAHVVDRCGLNDVINGRDMFNNNVDKDRSGWDELFISTIRLLDKFGKSIGGLLRLRNLLHLGGLDLGGLDLDVVMMTVVVSFRMVDGNIMVIGSVMGIVVVL